MFGIWRRGIAAAAFTLSVPAVATLFLAATPAHAGELEDVARKPAAVAPASLFGGEATQLTPTANEDLAGDPVLQATEMAKVFAADYHPETDRWTERNNRVKLTLYGSALFFGTNLRIQHDGGIGLRISWEVPGFIGIRLDNVYVPFSHIRVRNTGRTSTNSSTRLAEGFLNLTSLSIAIFNPELSAAPNLAMWAGFGVDLWEYHYNSFIHTSAGQARRYQYVDWNVGGNFFFNLEYKISDLFHIGFEWREHVVYAPQTERGQFYKVDNLVQGIGLHTKGTPHSRNQDFLAEIPLSMVHEFQIHVALVF